MRSRPARSPHREAGLRSAAGLTLIPYARCHCPTEKPFRQRQQIARLHRGRASLRLNQRGHHVVGDVGDRQRLPRWQEISLYVALGVIAPALGWQLVFDKVLRDGGKRIRPLARLFGLLAIEFLRWVLPFWISSSQSRAVCRAFSKVIAPYSPMRSRVGCCLPGNRFSNTKVLRPVADTRTPSPGTTLSQRS